MMKPAPVVIVTVAACLISTAFCCSLEYTCRQGNYIVDNPDISIYDSVNANQGGVACSAVMSGDKHLISIGSCGSVSRLTNYSNVTKYIILRNSQGACNHCIQSEQIANRVHYHERMPLYPKSAVITG